MRYLRLLYGGLPADEIYVASVMLSLSGMSIVFLAVLGTCVSVCQAVNKPYASVVIVALAIVVKAVANLILLPDPKVNVCGAAISETLCYLFATVCVIMYLRRSVGLRVDGNACVVKPLAAGMLMTLVITLAVAFASGVVETTLGTLALIAVCAAVYLGALWLLKTFDRTELGMLSVCKQKNDTYGKI